MCILVGTSVAAKFHKRDLRHDLKHEVSSFGFSQDDDSADAGDDAKAADLTDSIQGLFSDAPVVPPVAAAPTPKAASKAAPAKEAKAAVKAPQPKTNVKVAAKVAAKPQVVAKAAKPELAKTAVQQVQPKVVQAVAKPVAKKVHPTVVKTVAAKATAVAKKGSPKLQKAVAKAVAKAAAAPKAKLAAPVAKPMAKKVQPQVVKAAAPKPKAAAPKPKAKISPVAAKAPVATKVVHALAKPFSKKNSVVKVVKAKVAPAKMVAAKPAKVQAPAAKPAVAVAKAKQTHAQKKVQKVVAKLAKAAKMVGKATQTMKGAPPVPKLSKPIAKVQVAEKASQSTDALPVSQAQKDVTVSQKATTVKTVVSTRSNMKMPLTHAAAAHSGNATQDTAKAIAAVLPSLPMAGFALDDPAPVKNKTVVPKFPGNASQKAAWEKKEAQLEKELVALKARLATSNQSLASKHLVAPAQPKAAGTFSAGDSKEDKVSKKFMAASKAPEPMQPETWTTVRKDDKPKASWPTMNSVAAPVALHVAAAAGVPPQKEAVQEQEGSSKKVTMGSTFTGTPAKKVQSALALDATIEHETTVVADEIAAADSTASAAAPPSGVWGYISSFFSWATGRSAAAVEKPAAVPTPKAALLALAQKQRSLKQDMERTERQTQEESEHVIQVNDAWSQMEQEDNVKEDQVRREDMSERARAETAEVPHKPTKDELAGKKGVDMSNFWGKLEKEDYSIEHSVDTEDLGEYERLTSNQNEETARAVEQVENNKLAPERTTLKHTDDKNLAIHEPWLRRELRDVKAEKKIHDAPELQMLQLRHLHRRQ